ncbi:MAG TPA: lactate racemase domain-containing protein [Terriglobia bacterium]|nr:lactate racemase domain-containing protein [Terriglobia bacterium]
MKSTTILRTAAWYGDREIRLDFPPSWEVKVLSPDTPPPLTEQEIIEKLEHPVNQPSFRKICEGKSRPAIIVDDLNRPTPAGRVVPLLLQRFREAGIPAQNVTVVMATGTHGQPMPDAMLKKIGPEAASSCRLVAHDCFRDVKRIGRTTLGTPVFVNQNILDCDLVIGVSGIYPNHTAGFGGGSKLALGILGIRSIYHLHFRHLPASWGGDAVRQPIRRELDEIAGMIGMKTVISLMIDSHREVIQIYCGDPREYFHEAVAYGRNIFRACHPPDADVIIANTYPDDLSLTMARMKGFVPLRHPGNGASKVAIASCSEGPGLHNIFPFVNLPPHYRTRHMLRRLSVISLDELSAKGRSYLKRKFWDRTGKMRIADATSNGNSHHTNHPVWLYRPGNQTERLPSSAPGINLVNNWSAVVEAVQREQAGKDRLKVLLYACAPLQVPECVAQHEAALQSHFWNSTETIGRDVA